MKRLNDVLKEFQDFIEAEDIEDFIARGWVRPARDEKDFVFEDIDIARLRLVYELRGDMALEPESLDIVLSLMDQLYETRTRLNLLSKALEQQSEDIRGEIMSAMKKLMEAS